MPPVGSPAESRLQTAVRQLLPKLWDQAGRFERQVCDITRACIGVFQSRFLGADTFEFGDFVHTSQWLGKGTEGVVHLGFQISHNGRRVAVKKIERSLIDLHHWDELLNKGFQFLQKANHPSIVKLYHVEKLDSCWYAYMEYIDGGDLRSFLCPQDPSRKEPAVKMVLSEAKANEIFRKLVGPVDYLRRNGVIHRDLKPANFMLTRGGEVKLVDFATMRSDVAAGSLADSVRGTPAYMAPEIWLASKQKYDGEKVDVWSMGVILYEMVCGALPWIGEDLPSLFRNVNKKPLAIPASLGLSKDLCDLLEHTLKVKPQFRMTWVEVVSHAWLQEDPLAGVGNFLEETVNQLQLTVEKLQLKCRTLELGQEQKDAAILRLSKELQHQRDEAAQESQDELQRLLVQARTSHEKELGVLRAEMEAMRATAAAAQEAKSAELAALQTELDSVRSATVAKTAVEAMRAEIDQARSAANEEVAHAQAHAQQLTKEVATLTSELRVCQTREEDLKQKVLLSSRQVVQTQERLERCVKAQEAATAEVAQLRQSQAQLFAIQQRCEAAEQNATAERTRADGLAQDKTRLVLECEHLRSAMDDVLGNLTRSSEAVDLLALNRSLQQELDQTHRELERRTAELQERQVESDHLKQEMATLRFLVEESNNMN